MSPETSAVAPPKNAIVILLDSLNRHMLGAYGGTEFETPNLDRFAAERGALHPRTTRARCPACRRVTTSSAARSTSSGGPGARSRSGRTPDHPRAARRRRRHPADQRPSASVRGRRRELPLRLHAPGTTSAATKATPGRRVPIQLGRRAVVRPRLDALRQLARLVPRRGRLSRAEDHGRGGAMDRTRTPAPRALPALRRRVRSARAVRHARALGLEVRSGLARAAPDLAALRARARMRGACSTQRRRARSAPSMAPSSR